VYNCCPVIDARPSVALEFGHEAGMWVACPRTSAVPPNTALCVHCNVRRRFFLQLIDACHGWSCGRARTVWSAPGVGEMRELSRGR
jgi:hypothetical protein